jgi:rod shape-determining protein MreC
MSSFFKNKAVVCLVIITTCVILIAGFVGFSGDNPVSSAIKTVFSPFQSVVSKVTNTIDDTRSFIWEMKGYKEENERLITQLNEAKKQQRSVAEYREENERLKGLLDLQEDIDSYATVAAQVISYEPNNWYDTLVLNRGTNQGLQKGNAVITADGVVGRVVAVGSNWAQVSSIINAENAVGVRLSRTGDIAVAEGNVDLVKQGFCKMSFIDQKSDLIIGDVLETSDSSGIYPPGLIVGTVRELSTDASGNLQSAVIEPSVSFSNLYEVLVVTGMK